MTHPLAELTEKELSRLVHAVDQLLAGQPLGVPGHRPDRLRAGYGIEFLDHREFVPGDDLRTIDWRASARSRRPQIRRYWGEGAADWYICLDRSASMAIGDSEKWRVGIQCAAALAYLLIHLDNRVGLALFSSEVEQLLPPGRGPGHYLRLLNLLRSAKPRDSGGRSSLHKCAAVIPRHNPTFVISDFLVEDGMHSGLLALSRAGNRIHALQLLSPADSLLPRGTPVTVHDVESGVDEILDPTFDAQAELEQGLVTFSEALRNFCRKNRIAFSTSSTGQGWKAILANHLQGKGYAA